MSKVILNDGSVLDNLGLNGNNLISNEPVTADTFKGKLNGAVVVYTEGDTETRETLKNGVLEQITKSNDGKYWFILREKSAKEIIEDALTKDNANIQDLQLALAEIYEMIIN